MAYATFAQLRNEIKGAAENPTIKPYLLQALEWVTRRIDLITGYTFAPIRTIQPYDLDGFHIYDDLLDSVLYLGYPLLEPITVTIGDNTPLTINSEYFMRPPHGVEETPYWKLRRNNFFGWSSPRAFSYSRYDVIKIDGIWGWHNRYSKAWRSVSSLCSALNDSSLSFELKLPHGPDPLGRTPCISPGNIIRIDQEVMVVYDVETTSDIITVFYRGDRGTTEVSHLATAPVFVWEPMADITRACVRWAAYLQTRVGEFTQVSIDGGATIEFPTDAPGEVMNILKRYMDKSWQGV